MTKKIAMLIAVPVVAIMMQFAASTEASALGRCGHHFRADGTMMISVTRQSTCGSKGWQRDSRGRRYWGSAQTASPPTYYRGRRHAPRPHSYVQPQTHRPASVATNYIPGAPRNVAECYARGGTLANGGRGCAGYR